LLAFFVKLYKLFTHQYQKIQDYIKSIYNDYHTVFNLLVDYQENKLLIARWSLREKSYSLSWFRVIPPMDNCTCWSHGDI